MIWTTCKLLSETTETDKLGNPVKTGYETVGTYLCRPTPWSDTMVTADGRTVTRDDQRFALRAQTDIPDAKYCEVDGIVYEITSVSKAPPRFVVIEAKVYKR